jgi:hypothetical protein
VPDLDTLGLAAADRVAVLDDIAVLDQIGRAAGDVGEYLGEGGTRWR